MTGQTPSMLSARNLGYRAQRPPRSVHIWHGGSSCRSRLSLRSLRVFSQTRGLSLREDRCLWRSPDVEGLVPFRFDHLQAPRPRRPHSGDASSPRPGRGLRLPAGVLRVSPRWPWSVAEPRSSPRPGEQRLYPRTSRRLNQHHCRSMPRPPPPPRLPLPKLSAGVRGDRDERASALPPPKAPCRGLREAEAGPDGTPRASASEVDSQGAEHQGGALRGLRAAAGERGGRARERTPGAMSFQASAASGHRIRPRR